MKVEYSEDHRQAYFNGCKFRKDMKTGYYLGSKKTYKGKVERLHRYVWRFYNGPVPGGYQVHHIDGNKEHNDIENLALLSQFEHLSHHGNLRWENQPEKMIQNLKDNVLPAAAVWHGSEDGREWHKQHYENMKEKLHVEHEFICQNCGKKFFSTNTKSKFCSGVCASADRRKSGVDDEKRICVVCGKEFFCNKYAKSKSCSRECAGVLRWNKRHQAMRETTSLQYGG